MVSFKAKVKFKFYEFWDKHTTLGNILLSIYMYILRMVCLFKGHSYEYSCLIDEDEKGKYITGWCVRCNKKVKVYIDSRHNSKLKSLIDLSVRVR